jgi:chorismate-pyruvate lyase
MTFMLAAAVPAEIAQLQSALLAASSATAVLQAHCPADRIRAVRKRTVGKNAPPSITARLALTGAETVRYRRVRLMCGKALYSDADNWYVPERLTPAMNSLLNESEVPFGRVIAPLKATRQTLAVRQGHGRGIVVIEAVLTSEAGAPLSGVIERYQRAILTK